MHTLTYVARQAQLQGMLRGFGHATAAQIGRTTGETGRHKNVISEPTVLLDIRERHGKGFFAVDSV